MSIQPVQESILYRKTRSSQRITRNPQISSPRKDINDNPRPSKKAKKWNNSRDFDIYKDINTILEDQNNRGSSLLSISPKRPRITVEIPRRLPL